MSIDVTVATVSYNAEKYIEETIKSVSIQEQVKFEYIVRDGLSTDNTSKILNKHKSKIDLLIEEKDFNHFDAMNKVASVANGKFIIFMHADDLFIDSFSLKIMLDSLNSSKNNWLCGFQKTINSKNKVIREDKIKDFVFSDMLIANQVRHQTSLVPTEYFKEFNFDLKYKYASDYFFFLNLWKKYGPPHILKKHLVFQRMDGNNISSNFELMLKDEFIARKMFRKKYNYHFIFYVYDLIILYARYLKIKLFHNFFFKKN